MKTKEKKRYENANQIRDAIDRFRAKAQKLMNSAAALDHVADEFAKLGDNPGMVSFNREQAKKKPRSAKRVEEVQLVKLKHKLSEWQTEPLPGIIIDRSIPV